MCRMAATRADWYLSRGLAERLPEDDPRAMGAPGRTIRLLFAPNGKGNLAEPWLLQGKANVCVGCGSASEESDAAGESSAKRRHVRFGVVPHAFRRLLPQHMKSRDSHDIVLLCVECYSRLEPAYEARRSAAFAEYGVPRHPNHHTLHERQQEQVRSLALTLIKHGDKLPEARRTELHEQLAAETQLEPSQLTREALRGLASHVVHERDFRRKQRRELVSTEQRLLDAVLAGSGGDEAALHSFVESWRSLFVQTLRPTHLPAGWRTDHRRIKASS